MAQYVFLGFPLSTETPSPPAIPSIELSPFMSIDADDANVTRVTLTTHSGTHLDTPCHVIKGGLTLSDFGAEDFVFTHPLVIDLPLEDEATVQSAQLEPFAARGENADLLLFRFGYGPVRRAEPARYSAHAPGFGIESAQFLRERFPRLRAVGMDVPSLSTIAHLDETFQAHHVLLGGEKHKFLVIEDMNLEHDLAGLSMVVVAPLWIAGLDGGPCTVIGMCDA